MRCHVGQCYTTEFTLIFYVCHGRGVHYLEILLNLSNKKAGRLKPVQYTRFNSIKKEEARSHKIVIESSNQNLAKAFLTLDPNNK